MKKLAIKIIKFYQKHISKKLQKCGIDCRYKPTCSEYTKQAIEKYGIVLGSFKGFWRILRCNPFSKGGVDELK